MTIANNKSDAEIQQAVLRELKWDTRVKETDVGVQVANGIVTLSGTVPSWAKREAAQEAAHRVAGVLDVANDVIVRFSGGEERSDTDLAFAVRSALEWDVLVPDTRIRSTISHGDVTLEGDVDYAHEREDAVRAVRNLRGVRSVSNRIELKPPPVTSEDLRASIEAALERQAEREAQHLSLRVERGSVTVSGSVRSSAEKAAVLGTVRGTAGVRQLNDDLRIERDAR
jgi:osmotically-inducible protein OsmY